MYYACNYASVEPLRKYAKVGVFALVSLVVVGVSFGGRSIDDEEYFKLGVAPLDGVPVAYADTGHLPTDGGPPTDGDSGGGSGADCDGGGGGGGADCSG